MVECFRRDPEAQLAQPSLSSLIMEAHPSITGSDVVLAWPHSGILSAESSRARPFAVSDFNQSQLFVKLRKCKPLTLEQIAEACGARSDRVPAEKTKSIALSNCYVVESHQESFGCWQVSSLISLLIRYFTHSIYGTCALSCYETTSRDT